MCCSNIRAGVKFDHISYGIAGSNTNYFTPSILASITETNTLPDPGTVHIYGALDQSKVGEYNGGPAQNCVEIGSLILDSNLPNSLILGGEFDGSDPYCTRLVFIYNTKSKNTNTWSGTKTLNVNAKTGNITLDLTDYSQIYITVRIQQGVAAKDESGNFTKPDGDLTIKPYILRKESGVDYFIPWFEDGIAKPIVSKIISYGTQGNQLDEVTNPSKNTAHELRIAHNGNVVIVSEWSDKYKIPYNSELIYYVTSSIDT
jgi:hypothetical protein